MIKSDQKNHEHFVMGVIYVEGTVTRVTVGKSTIKHIYIYIYTSFDMTVVYQPFV